MATRHGDAFQQEERVGLKRKPTGPPRLLLGRTRARSTKDVEPETKLEKMENSEDGLGHCEAAGEGDDIRNRRRWRWWSRFSSAVICIKEEDGSEKPPQGALQDPNTLNVTEGGCKRSFKEDKRFNLRMMTKRFTTSSDIPRAHRQRGGGASLSLQKRLQEFFMRARQPVLLENMKVEEELEEEDPRVEEEPQVEEKRQEEKPQVEESQLKEGLQVDEPTQQQNDGTDGHPEELMVNQLIEDGAAAESPELTKTTADDFQDAADGSETIQTTSANQVLVQLVSSEEDQVFSDPEIRVDVDVQLSSQEKTELTTSRSHQPSTNRPTIRIELCPPDDVIEEDEEEACWQGSSSQQNSLHLLLSFDHGERQLLQTARSLVRAAMTAAIDQLTREQQNGCMQREPQGCRDHA
ncbi:uncharacterized protein LOC121633610 [Melanotaenia boesemani]|uniref:uncharacterized protein LOC121633610 n=1 Tax=Melanotaenia boesemani TaxID=1250792 RepID=UPI001C03AA67|nr:uncharacterized protein LOC121633610 [Melanotaenia boesemani]